MRWLSWSNPGLSTLSGGVPWYLELRAHGNPHHVFLSAGKVHPVSANADRDVKTKGACGFPWFDASAEQKERIVSLEAKKVRRGLKAGA